MCCVLQPSPSTSVYMRAVATANMTVNTSHRDMVLMNQGRRARDIILCGWLLYAAIFFFFWVHSRCCCGCRCAHCTSAQNATRLTKMTGAGFTIFVVVHSLACQRWFVARRRGTSTNEATPSRMDNAMWMQFWWRTPRLYGHMGMWECWWLSKLMPVTGWGRLNWGRTVIAWPPFFRDQHFFFRIFLPRPFIGANK